MAWYWIVLIVIVSILLTATIVIWWLLRKISPFLELGFGILKAFGRG